MTTRVQIEAAGYIAEAEHGRFVEFNHPQTGEYLLFNKVRGVARRHDPGDSISLPQRDMFAIIEDLAKRALRPVDLASFNQQIADHTRDGQEVTFR